MTNIEKIFRAHGPEAARKAARRAGDGNAVAEFLRLQREAQEKAVVGKKTPANGGGRPAPRVGKSARSGGRAASLARKRARAETDRARREAMRGSSSGGGKKK